MEELDKNLVSRWCMDTRTEEQFKISRVTTKNVFLWGNMLSVPLELFSTHFKLVNGHN